MRHARRSVLDTVVIMEKQPLPRQSSRFFRNLNGQGVFSLGDSQLSFITFMGISVPTVARFCRCSYNRASSFSNLWG
jgi:hypothetical protein